jgi:hypothetical protein
MQDEAASAIEHTVTINGQAAGAARILVIQFSRDTFDRREDLRPGEHDPPLDLVFAVANRFLRRLRIVTAAAQISDLRQFETTGRIEYRRDDGSELDREPGLVRLRVFIHGRVEIVGVTPEIWRDTEELPMDFAAPRWTTLLLDARGLLPESVGPAIVLAFAALETLIDSALDILARGQFPERLWEWISARGERYELTPSVPEQYDVVLEGLSGQSLKADNVLWQALQNLRDARNSFVHDGQARIGRRPGRLVSEEDAARLIHHAFQIVDWIRDRLPEDARWPKFEHKNTIQVTMKLKRAESEEPVQAPGEVSPESDPPPVDSSPAD